jgi:hypothetical protein
MPILVTCQCGKRFAAKEHLFGRQVPCPACGKLFTVSTTGLQAAGGIFATCVCGRSFHAPETMRGQEARCRCGRVLQLAVAGSAGSAKAVQPGELDVLAAPARVETPTDEYEIPWRALKRIGLAGVVVLTLVVIVTTIIHHIIPMVQQSLTR